MQLLGEDDQQVLDRWLRVPAMLRLPNQDNIVFGTIVAARIAQGRTLFKVKELGGSFEEEMTIPQAAFAMRAARTFGSFVARPACDTRVGARTLSELAG